MATLILLRHGESDWNEKNLFTGWVDVDLTEKGVEQARLAGLELKKAELLPTVLHTSLLTRAIRTSNIALEACERSWIPVKRHWRLNERHYGALQGLDKSATREKYGDEQFRLWRRSYDTPPPPIEPGSEWDVSTDIRYRLLSRDLVPRTECLADVVARMLPYWYDQIVPDLRADETVIIAAHGNSLRGLVAHLDGLSREEVVGLNIPTGQPLKYVLDEELQPTVRGGEYLDAEAAEAAAASVAAQGH
jgi:2,3-bisphosphoglycerate-dependent phosphoglycerate mutase